MSTLLYALRAENRNYFFDCVGYCYSHYLHNKLEGQIKDLTRSVDDWQVKERAEGALNLIVQPSYFTIRLGARIVVLASRYVTMIAVTFGALFNQTCRDLFLASFVRLMITHGRLVSVKFQVFTYAQIALAVIGSVAQIIKPTLGLKILSKAHQIDVMLDDLEMACFNFERKDRFINHKIDTWDRLCSTKAGLF